MDVGSACYLEIAINMLVAFIVFALCSFLFAFYLYDRVARHFERWCSLHNFEFSDRTKFQYKVGILERMIYIMLIGIGHTYIILGWIALKALQNPFKSCSAEDKTASDHYHLIILGNCISLFCGIVGGIVAHIWLHPYLK